MPTAIGWRSSPPVSNEEHCKYRGCFWNGKKKAEKFSPLPVKNMS